jgi:short-subunit dehydrogenase
VGVTVLCPSFFRTNIHQSARGTDPRMRGFIDKLMSKAKLSADDVARIALDGAAHGDLYVLPMRDGRVMWNLKRLTPSGWARLSRSVLRIMEKRMA